MKNVCHASFSSIRKFFRNVLAEPVSRGYPAKRIRKVSQFLEQPYEELRERIPLEATLNVDETGHKDNGDRFWTWVFKAELYVLFRIDKSRGSKVLIEVLGREFEGALGCDYFSAYRKYMKDFQVPVQFCIAHLIRDIEFLVTLPDKLTRAYGEKPLGAVKAMFKVIYRYKTFAPEDFRAALEQVKAQIIHIAIAEAPSQLDEEGKERKREARNMAERFRKHGQALLRVRFPLGIDPQGHIPVRFAQGVRIPMVVCTAESTCRVSRREPSTSCSAKANRCWSAWIWTAGICSVCPSRKLRRC